MEQAYVPLEDYIKLKQSHDELWSLVDSASVVVELFEAKSPSMVEWRKKWLKTAWSYAK